MSFHHLIDVFTTSFLYNINIIVFPNLFLFVIVQVYPAQELQKEVKMQPQNNQLLLDP